MSGAPSRFFFVSPVPFVATARTLPFVAAPRTLPFVAAPRTLPFVAAPRTLPFVVSLSNHAIGDSPSETGRTHGDIGEVSGRTRAACPYCG